VTCDTRRRGYINVLWLSYIGWFSQFQPYSIVAAANQKWRFRAFTDVAGVICRRIATGRGRSSRSRPLRISRTAPDDHFRSVDATVENTWNRLAIRPTAGIHRQTVWHALGTAQKRHLYLWAATLAYGRKLLDQPHPTQVCELWDTPTGILDVVWLSYRLAQSISTVFHRGGSKPEVVFLNIPTETMELNSMTTKEER